MTPQTTRETATRTHARQTDLDATMRSGHEPHPAEGLDRSATRTVRVLHVVHSLQVGGLEQGVVNVIRGAPPHQHHTVVCMTTDGPLRDRLPAGTAVHMLGKRPGHDLAMLWRLGRLLRQLRPDVVHSRNWGTFDSVFVARLARVPIVVHGEHGREISDTEGRNRRRNRMRRLCAPLVDRFVTVSESLRHWLVDDVHIPARRVVTIRNGVDVARFAGIDRAAARSLLDLPPNAPVIGTVGRLDPVKNQAGLIRAVTRLRTTHPDAMLVIAGDGAYRAELERLIDTVAPGGNIRLLGERRDIPNVLAALDVFALPSVAEGMSNTILEAMAAGLPVVATAVGGSPELVADGVNGSLVPAGDEPALTAALSRYCSDAALRGAHGDASRRCAAADFGLRRMQDAYSALYDTLVRERSGNKWQAT